jgi:hypothetical protein
MCRRHPDDVRAVMAQYLRHPGANCAHDLVVYVQHVRYQQDHTGGAIRE